MKTGILLLSLAIALVIQTEVSLAQDSLPNQSPPQEAGRFRVEMVDGTIVYGSPNIKIIELDIEFDRVSIPIEKIRAIKLISASVVDKNLNVIVKEDPTRRFLVELKNNDRFSGQILNPPFVVLFSAGKVTLPFEELKAVQSMSAGNSVGSLNTGGPIFHFAFEGTSNTIAKNRVKDKHHLRLNGAQRVTKSKVRKGIRLGGATTMTIPHSQELCPQKFTLAAWIKPTGDRSNYAFIVGKSNSNSWNGGFAFAYMSSDPTHVHFYVNGYQQQIVRAVVKSDQWSHLTGTCDGESVVMYLNGKEVHRVAYPKGQSVQHTSGNLSIGGDPAKYHWTGEIDEIAMYNHALAPEQVKQLYNQHILP